MARVHHLNASTLCPTARRLVSGEGSFFERGRMICHCLLVESEDGLVLVDSGFGLRDGQHREDIAWPLRLILGAAFDPEDTAIGQVKKLGFRPEDVRHIVVTHLDLDHAGGLADFPWATVHLHAAEHRAALHPSARERPRYLQNQWAHGPKWRPYSEEGEPWLGFSALRPLDGLKDIALVPLTGHSRGHSGVLVQGHDRAILHAGDAYFFHGELETPPRCPAGLAAFQALVQIDGKSRRANAARLRQLHAEQGPAVDILCAHDPWYLDQATAR